MHSENPLSDALWGAFGLTADHGFPTIVHRLRGCLYCEHTLPTLAHQTQGGRTAMPHSLTQCCGGRGGGAQRGEARREGKRMAEQEGVSGMHCNGGRYPPLALQGTQPTPSASFHGIGNRQ